MAPRQALDLLGERPSTTPAVIAEEPADPQGKDDEPAAERPVSQAPPIRTVHPCRRCPAARAGGGRGSTVRIDPNDIAVDLDSIDHQVIRFGPDQPSECISIPHEPHAGRAAEIF